MKHFRPVRIPRLFMTFFPRFFRPISTLILVGVLATASSAVSDRKFTTSPTLAKEVRVMVEMMSQLHYNRDAVRSSDYAEVVSEYMGSLDGQRLFFLQSDEREFENQFNSGLFWELKKLGNIDAAYAIFKRYEQRVEERANWVLNYLDSSEADFSDHDRYQYDRRDIPWPTNQAASDELWRTRIEYELIAELLNDKTSDEAKEKVRKRYQRMLKNVADLEGHELAELYLSTIARLYDPHSTYFSADTYEDFAIQMKLELVGIGALLSLEDDYCVIKEIVPGGPVDLGNHLQPNDRILAVAQGEGESVEIIGMKLRKIVQMIRGVKGTNVHLTIQPADGDNSARREVIITRDVVKLNSARAHAAVFQVPDETGVDVPIGVISLPSFYAAPDDGDPETADSIASRDVAKLIDQLNAAGIEGMVLDLRRNGGGYLKEAIDVTGLFIEQGPVVQVRDYAGQIQVDSDEDANIAYEGPLAVLVDRFSASASEIVAGALQNYGRAVVIGDSSTHGKGSVQTVVEMKRYVPQFTRSPLKTGAAKLTVQKYYLPNGNSTQLKGVIPDITLPSIGDFLKIGERDLPHALVWDEIPTSNLNGSPLDPQLLTILRNSSEQRRQIMPEFDYLDDTVDWFKARQEEKLISLNLEARHTRKEQDKVFRDVMKETKDRLAENDYPFEEFRLVPKPPARIKAEPTTEEEKNNEVLSTDDNDSYAKVDVHLRESLRVINDAISLAKSQKEWASNRQPLTAITGEQG